MEVTIAMKRPTHNSPYAFSMAMTVLAVASWETIWRGSFLMAQGTCTLAEYRRMAEEKAVALQMSTAAFISGRGQAAVLAPFVNRARANARRLRRKG
jgi:hypothetical protein